MLLELAIGDSVGRVFEFGAPAEIDAKNDGIQYHLRKMPSPKYPENFTPDPDETPIIGKYTDDTQMSIAIAEHMLSQKPHTQVNFVNAFLQAYKRDVVKGYSKRLTSALSSSENAEQFLANIKPRAKSNGSVMRTVPLGLLPTPSQVIHACIAHTSATHATIEALHSTIAVALTAHYFYNGGIEKNYYDWMCIHMGYADFNDIFDHYHGGEIECNAVMTASRCMQLAVNFNSMTIILKKSIETGGDVDSVAAVALGIASLKREGINDLSKTLYENLENGIYGRDYLHALDQQLFEMYPKVNLS